MKNQKKERRLMSFAGIGKGIWGSTPEEVEQTIRDLRASWERSPSTEEAIGKSRHEYQAQAVESFENFQATKKHISLDELESWASSLNEKTTKKLPSPHL